MTFEGYVGSSGLKEVRSYEDTKIVRLFEDHI